MTNDQNNRVERESARNNKTQEMSLLKHIHFEQIDSTNTWAKLHPDQWDSKGLTLVTASGQSGGLGRFKRKWISPPHLNIYASFCFWFDSQRTDMGHIPQVLAISAAKAIESLGFSSTIKWPNDLLLNNKKIAGILCETILEKQKRGIVCGIGLNVNMPLEILNQIDRPATSLWVEGGRLYEQSAVLRLLQENFIADLNTFLNIGFPPLFPLLKARSALKKGQKISFHDNQTLINAQFMSLEPDGSVKLQLTNGDYKTFYAGEFIY